MSLVSATFMIVDCGGGTVDLTTRKLVGNKPLQLGEVTERIGDFCGSTFIDEKFVEFLREKLGSRPIDRLIENHYGQYQYLIQEFCQRVKILFTGDDMRFHYELDINHYNAPDLLKYISEESQEIKEEWAIDIKYSDIKKMFDFVVDRIIRLIDMQLSNNRGTCSAMFLVGGFSQNEYLQKKIKDKFNNIVEIISVPSQPIAAIARGAAIYGLDYANFFKNPLNAENANKMNNLALAISTRVLKYTYGIKIIGRWKKDEHPSDRKIHNDRIYLFETFVKRGTEVKVNEEFVLKGYKTLSPNQDALTFELLKSPEYNVKYPDEPGIEPVGKLRILLPSAYNNSNYKPAVTFGFSLGKSEITAFARNEIDPTNLPKKNGKNNEKNWFFGQNFQTKFDLSQENE
jgi:molecular chaperone DnaK (HSP70)